MGSGRAFDIEDTARQQVEGLLSISDIVSSDDLWFCCQVVRRKRRRRRAVFFAPRKGGKTCLGNGGRGSQIKKQVGSFLLERRAERSSQLDEAVERRWQFVQTSCEQ